MADPQKELEQAVINRKAIFVIGSGVSYGASAHAPCASWKGLLDHAVDHIVKLNRTPHDKWAPAMRERIRGNQDAMVSAAEKISKRLKGADPEFSKWLRDAFEKLEVKKPAVFHALRDMGVVLATTNYDDLLERATGFEAVTWKEPEKAVRVLRGDYEKGVLHLHGHWKHPDSVVLGTRSYQEVVEHKITKTMLKAMAVSHTLVFVGCGDGLKDPHLGGLLKWMGKVLSGTEHRHFRLALQSEARKLQKEHPPEQRIVVIPYGKTHDDLARFLRKLCPPPRSVGARMPAHKKYHFLLSDKSDFTVKFLNELGPPRFESSECFRAPFGDPKNHSTDYRRGLDAFIKDPKSEWLLTVYPEDENNEFNKKRAERDLAKIAEAQKRIICFESGGPLLDIAKKHPDWAKSRLVTVIKTNTAPAFDLIKKRITAFVPPQRFENIVVVFIPGPDCRIANERRQLYETFLAELQASYLKDKTSRKAADPGGTVLRTAITPPLDNWKSPLAGTWARRCVPMCDFKNPSSHTFIFCGNDEIAVNAWTALKKKIPKEKVWFFGFDALQMAPLLNDQIYGGTVEPLYGAMCDFARKVVDDPFSVDENPKAFEGELFTAE